MNVAVVSLLVQTSIQANDYFETYTRLHEITDVSFAQALVYQILMTIEIWRAFCFYDVFCHFLFKNDITILYDLISNIILDNIDISGGYHGILIAYASVYNSSTHINVCNYYVNRHIYRDWYNRIAMYFHWYMYTVCCLACHNMSIEILYSNGGCCA